jgi:hypothetical protein
MITNLQKENHGMRSAVPNSGSLQNLPSQDITPVSKQAGQKKKKKKKKKNFLVIMKIWGGFCLEKKKTGFFF